MSEVKVNKISPRTACGTVTLGDSGDSFVIPAGATITNNGTQTGFGRTGAVNWQTTTKTANFSAVNGEGYFVDTTSGGVIMTMPSGSAGSIVSIQDYNKTFDNNSFTITPASGQKINGGDADGVLIISTEGQGLTFVYVDSTVGWKTVQENDFISGGSTSLLATGGTITTINCGACKVHTFTGPGTFCVAQVSATPANNEVSYMVVAGGGGAGSTRGGGGGAGGFREDKSPVTPYTASPLDGAGPITITATSFPITVGAGGAGGPSQGCGSNSIFSTITSAGGAKGGHYSNGHNGGSGSGGSNDCYTGGSGNTPPVSPPQGNDGGDSTTGGGAAGAGGGGGATAAGGNGSASVGGPGGAGATTGINGTPTAFAGGGGGGVDNPGSASSGGAGGGGAGNSGPGNGTAGTANTGGGGGGTGYNGTAGGAGGSGVVIIRYKV
jgi:hypothetical protein